MKQNEQFVKSELKKIKYEHIFHYTSLDALYSIITNKEIWLADISTMNDKMENLEFLNEIKYDLTSTFPSKNEEILGLIKTIEAGMEDQYPFALCCTSLNDDAAQWERYADSAKGVRIAFDTETLIRFSFSTPLSINNVFYEFPHEEHEIYYILKHYLQTGEILQFENIDALIGNICLTASSFKHKSFMGESELRLRAPNLEKHRYHNNYCKFEYGCKKGVIKKYMKVDFDKLCRENDISMEKIIDNIMIGPRSTQNKRTLTDFCIQNGFKNLKGKITYSECPLR